MPSVASNKRIKYHHWPLECGCSVPLKKHEHKKMVILVGLLDKLLEDGLSYTKAYKDLRIKAERLLNKGMARKRSTSSCASVANVLKRYYN